MSRAGIVEVWGSFIDREHVRSDAVAVVKHLGNANTIRGVRMIAKKHPTATRFVLKGTADQLDRANGHSHTWTHQIDLVTRYVGVDYEIVKESPRAT